jgi:hypothetical protein
MLLFYDRRPNNTIPRLENVSPRLGEFPGPLGSDTLPKWVIQNIPWAQGSPIWISPARSLRYNLLDDRRRTEPSSF